MEFHLHRMAGVDLGLGNPSSFSRSTLSRAAEYRSVYPPKRANAAVSSLAHRLRPTLETVQLIDNAFIPGPSV